MKDDQPRRAQISGLAYDREYERWTAQEYARLLDHLRGDLSIERIGVAMQRTPSTLHARMKYFHPEMKRPAGDKDDDWLPEVRASLRGQSKEHWLSVLRTNYRSLSRYLPKA